jgi:hypothetical protein
MQESTILLQNGSFCAILLAKPAFSQAPEMAGCQQQQAILT